MVENASLEYQLDVCVCLSVPVTQWRICSFPFWYYFGSVLFSLFAFVWVFVLYVYVYVILFHVSH